MTKAALAGSCVLCAAAAVLYGCRSAATINYGPATANAATAPVPSPAAPSPDAQAPAATPMAPASADAPQAVEFTRRESGLLVGPLEETGSLEAAALWTARDRRDVFLRRMSNQGEDERIVRRIESRPDEAESPRRDIVIEAADPAADLEPGLNELSLDAEGEITILRNDANRIASEFTPPALFMPPVLGAGDELEREFAVRSEGPPFGKGSGEGTSAVRGVGRQVVRTPAGDFETFVLESRLDFSVGPAVISLFTRGWVEDAPGGAGLVAEEGREVVKVFGLKFYDVSRVSVLESTGAVAGVQP